MLQNQRKRHYVSCQGTLLLSAAQLDIPLEQQHVNTNDRLLNASSRDLSPLPAMRHFARRQSSALFFSHKRSPTYHWRAAQETKLRSVSLCRVFLNSARSTEWEKLCELRQRSGILRPLLLKFNGILGPKNLWNLFQKPTPGPVLPYSALFCLSSGLKSAYYLRLSRCDTHSCFQPFQLKKNMYILL